MMRRFALWVVLCLSAAGPCLAVDAAQLYKKARDAEHAGKLDEAYFLYSEAAAMEPGNRTYWLRSQAVRGRAALKAASVTGSLPADLPDLPPEGKLEPATAKELAEAKKPQPPAELKAPPDRKDFDLTGDSRNLFEKVAQAYGLDCVFDGDYQPGRPIRFQLESADYREALHALELATGSFLVPLTDKLFLVAKDTAQKRSEVEPWISETVQVPEAMTPQDLTQIATAVQQSVALERVAYDSQTNRVVLRGPISKVIPARELFVQLMHPRPQVMVDMDFYEVNRSDLLNWGISLPDFFSIQPFGNLSNGLTMLSNILRWGPSGTLLSVAIGSAQAMAQFSRTNAKSLQHLELRSVDGQAASFHIGERYPVLTSGYFGSAVPTTNGVPGTTTNPNTGNGLQTPSTFGSVANPAGVFSGDFNRDGIPDFAAAASGSNQVAVFLGNGNGTFADPVTYATGQNPSAILAVDLNGDGYFDLVTADADSNDIGVLLGNGDGTFKAVNTFAAGTQPSALVTADFNGDGFPDIAVANANSNTVSIFLGNGDGTFQQAITVEAGTSPRALATGDWNGDGIADLAVANYSSNDLWILMGNGDGTFRKSAAYATGNGPRGLVANTINPDSYLDLIVANSGSNTVSVFLGDGTGAFTGGAQFATGSGPVALVTADFNLDTLKDVAVANQADGTLSLLLGLGDGTFQSAIQIGIGSGTQPVALVTSDYNRDGYPDLLTANFGTNDFSILLGQGNGGFTDSNGNSYQFSGGQTYAPPPAFTYEDLGLVVKLTPHIHGAGAVGLELEAEIKLLTGKSVNGVPEIAQRKLQSQVQLGDGESGIVAGLLSASDAHSILGIAGLSSLPGLGPLLRSNTRDRESSEILIVVKPHIIGVPPAEYVSRPIWIGTDAHPLTPM